MNSPEGQEDIFATNKSFHRPAELHVDVSKKGSMIEVVRSLIMRCAFPSPAVLELPHKKLAQRQISHVSTLHIAKIQHSRRQGKSNKTNVVVHEKEVL